MNCLLDSHALIWSLLLPHKLSRNAYKVIEDQQNELFVSHVSFWEISLKYSLGKLDLLGAKPDEIPNWCRRSDIKTISLSENDVASFYKLPRSLHKDPYDRMLVWQAINRQLVLITKDDELKAYYPAGLSTLW